MLSDHWAGAEAWSGPAEEWDTGGLLQAIVASSGPAAWDGHTRFSGSKGVNLVPLGFAQYTDWSSAYFNAQITSTRLQTLKTSGFDFVRLAVDPTPFYVSTDNFSSETTVVTNAITAIQAVGLKVILDAHVETAGTTYYANSVYPTTGSSIVWYDAAIEADYPSGPKWLKHLAVIKQFAIIAAMWSTAQVALDPFNENTTNNGDSSWQAMALAMVRAIRTVNLATTVIIGGTSYDSIQGIQDMVPGQMPDTNLIYELHHYLPRAFGEGGIGGDVQYTSVPAMPLRWPPVASDQTLQVQKAEAAGAVANSSSVSALNAYFSTPQDAGYERSLYTGSPPAGVGATVEQWRIANNLLTSQMMVTELGCPGQYSFARDITSRACWFQDMTQIFASLPYGWCLWDYAPGLNNDDWQNTNQDTAGNLLAEVSVACGLVTTEAYQAEATALIARMSPPPSQKHQDAINATIKLLKAEGLWSLLDVFVLTALETSQQSLLNWKGASNSLALSGSPAFTPGGGFATSSSAYLTCPYIPGASGTSYSQNSGHIGLWQSTASTADQPLIVDGQYDLTLGIGSASLLANVGASAQSYGSKTNVTVPGHVAASRVAASGYQTYANGSLQATVSAASVAVTTASYNTLSIGNAGNTGRAAIVHAGGGLSQAQMRGMAAICRFLLQAL